MEAQLESLYSCTCFMGPYICYMSIVFRMTIYLGVSEKSSRSRGQYSQNVVAVPIGVLSQTGCILQNCS